MEIDPFYVSRLLWDANFRDLTSEELAYLKLWFDTDPIGNEQLLSDINDMEWIRKSWSKFTRFDPEEGWEDVIEKIQERQKQQGSSVPSGKME